MGLDDEINEFKTQEAIEAVKIYNKKYNRTEAKKVYQANEKQTN